MTLRFKPGLAALLAVNLLVGCVGTNEKSATALHRGEELAAGQFLFNSVGVRAMAGQYLFADGVIVLDAPSDNVAVPPDIVAPVDLAATEDGQTATIGIFGASVTATKTSTPNTFEFRPSDLQDYVEGNPDAFKNMVLSIVLRSLSSVREQVGVSVPLTDDDVSTHLSEIAYSLATGQTASVPVLGDVSLGGLMDLSIFGGKIQVEFVYDQYGTPIAAELRTEWLPNTQAALWSAFATNVLKPYPLDDGAVSATGIEALESGHMLVSFAGAANHSYEVQATSNFVDWQNLALITAADSSGSFSFEDTDAPNIAARFYRAVDVTKESVAFRVIFDTDGFQPNQPTLQPLSVGSGMGASNVCTSRDECID